MLDYRKKVTQNGRSMIEMLGVLAIVGVLSAGGIAGYSMAMQSYKTNLLMERINLVATRARSVYKGIYTGISAENMIKSGKLSANDFANPFGSSITLESGSDGTYFFLKTAVTDRNLPAETCVDLLTAYWGDSGVFDGVSDSTTYFAYGNGKYPVSPSDAITACNGGNKFLSFHFR